MTGIALCALLVVALLAGPASGGDGDPAWIARGARGMVASDSPQASRIGVDVLKAGGNAVDAACAVSFALGVTRPYSTGLGGGGFMILRLADGRTVALDYRETAPATASANMYAAKPHTDEVDITAHPNTLPTTPHPNTLPATKAESKAAPKTDSATDPKDLPPPSRFGPRAVAVPGVLKGWMHAVRKYGTISIERALQPAMRIAIDGFPVDQHYIDAVRDVRKSFDKYPELKSTCSYVFETHLRNADTLKPGWVLKQPRLGRMLDVLARTGPDQFYAGLIADAVDEAMALHRAPLTADDLAAYAVKQREPIVFSYRQYQILAMGPPSSGGVALAESLNILELFDLPTLARSDRGAAAHLQVEAMKHAFADRSRWLADPDFVDVPVDILTSKTYAEQLAETINPVHVGAAGPYGSLPSGHVLDATPPDDAGTSHFCVVDRWGNAVVATETINTTFGSCFAIARYGLILNNEMDDFTVAQGQPNAFGLVQSSRNAIAGNKRPLSSMSPTIVLENDKPFLLLGASGGPRIISAVLSVLLNITDFDMPLDEAVRAVRFHHQWRPDEVVFDGDPPESLRRALAARRHRIADKRRGAVVQVIQRVKDGWVGASDPRKGGRPAGY